MIYNPYYFNPLFLYPIPDINLNPPTLYSLLESIVNYGKEEKTAIKDLAKEGHLEIFNFDYDLTDKITKEYFETQIINHYLTRRIGFETLTAFRIQLNCKINEILPLINQMFNSLDSLDIFGPEIITRVGYDTTIREANDNTSSTLENTSNTTNSNVNDLRRSDTPQNNLAEVRDGEYVTEYNYNTGTANSIDISNSKRY